jgi:putative lipoic acid-binding regulatory protein
MTNERITPLEFPSEFMIKVVGKNTAAFEAAVFQIFNQYVPDLSEGAFTSRHSKEKNYLAMTVTITATSQSQLDQIYSALSATEEVIMAL